MNPLPLEIAAAVFFAWCVDRFAHDVIHIVSLDRLVIERDAVTTRVSYSRSFRRSTRAGVVLRLGVYSLSLAFCTAVMLAAVLDTRGSSDLGRVAYATSFVFDVATIGRTAVRVYRLTTNTV